MAEAYAFLRRLEHRLQMIDDKQTQELPKEDDKIDLVGVFMGYDDGAAFRAVLRHHLERVEHHYADLFEEAPDLGGAGALVFTGSENHPDTVETLTGMGFSDGGSVRSEEHTSELQSLMRISYAVFCLKQKRK